LGPPGSDGWTRNRSKPLGAVNLFAIVLVNAEGKVVNFSRRWPIPDIDISDRDFFRTLRDHDQADVLVTEPVKNRYVLSNAVKFTPSAGRVRITVDHSAEGGLAIAITDTGIGMRRQDIATALTPFRQLDSGLNRRHEGTGLGLPLAKTLTELHGGRLEIDSEPGLGTTVKIHLLRERIVIEERAAELRAVETIAS